MIQLVDVSVSYDDATPLNRVNLKIDKGATTVVGPSGSGKSTLLRVVAGLQAPDAGQVVLNGLAVLTPTWRRGGDPRVGMIHQDYRLVPFLTVAENIALASELKGDVPAVSEMTDTLEQVGLTSDFLERSPTSLSGGEQQRVAIARALLAGVEVLLADEPTGALDAANSTRVTEILVDVGRQRGVCVLIATHDPLVANIVPARLSLTDGVLCAVN